MQPRKILIFLVLLLVLTTAIAILFPKDGIAVDDSLRLKFHFSFSDLFSEDIKYADINNILAENQSIIASDSIITNNDELVDTVRANVTDLKAKVQPIEYPAGDTSVLFTFFEKLDNSHKKRVRILHYGDSQIEGDRITGYLRNRFQKQFGGSGPGLLPAIPGSAESSSIKHTVSSNWQSHSVYYKKDTILPHRQFGVLGSFARFTSYHDDTFNINPSIKKATLEFSRSGMAYSSVNNFTQCRVFYGHSNDNFLVKGFVNDSLVWFEELDTVQDTKNFQWNFKRAPRDFIIEFEGDKSPDIYGIALDAPRGVAVDNLPFRGSWGTEFSRLDYTQFRGMAKYLKTGLVILEFGVNVVPYQVRNYDFYEHSMTRELNYLKKIFPNSSFLVIGLSDMSRRKGNYYESYPNIEKIRKAQKNAAKNANCAFWDLYTAMGGKNSMPSWVFAQPPLAGKDFTHFNRTGGHIIAQMLFNALMKDYSKYETVKQKDLLSEKH